MYSTTVELFLILFGGVCLISSQQAPGPIPFLPNRQVPPGGRLPIGGIPFQNQGQFPTGKINTFAQRSGPQQVPNGRALPQGFQQGQPVLPNQQRPIQRAPTSRAIPQQGSQIPRGRIPTRGQFQQSGIPQVPFQNGQIPRGQFSGGQTPQRQIPLGQIPTRQSQQGQFFRGQIPTRQIPQRQFLNGQIPQVQIPQGQIPGGQIPRQQQPFRQIPGQPPRGFPTSPQGTPQVIGRGRAADVARMPSTG